MKVKTRIPVNAFQLDHFAKPGATHKCPFIAKCLSLQVMRRYLFLFFLLLMAPLAHAAPQFLDDEAEKSSNISFVLQKAASGQFSLYFDFQNPANGYVMTANASGASLAVIQNGKRQVLASAPVSWKAQNTVTLQRRPWMMRLLVNDAVVLTAFDASYTSGKIGMEATGWNFKDARVQPVENIRFDDDFTRAGREGDDSWAVTSGKWSLSASSDQVNARNANMSSNPFAYEASAPNGTAFATVGRKFWDSYDARVASRPEGKGVIGIAAYVQDSKNYFAFLWSGNEGATARRLVRVQNGVSTVLASAIGAYLPHQWYEIGLRTSPGYVEAMIDGSPVMRAKNNSLGQGGIGLIAQNLQSAAFDDVQVRSYDFYRQDLATSDGAWTANGAFRVTGRSDWDGYRLIVSPKITQNGAFGVVTGFKDSQNYTVFRAAAPQSKETFHGHAQLVRYQKGVAQVLSDRPFLPALVGTPRVSLSAQGGAVSVALGDEIIAQAAQPGLTAGRTGVWNAPAFGTETVVYFPPAPDPQKIAERMEDDAYMVGWASPTGEWPPTEGKSGLEFWNTGEFFGDASLDFAWRPNYKGTFEIALRAERSDFESGYVVRGQSSDDRKSINWSLRRGLTTLGQANVALKIPEDDTEGGMPFKIALQGKGILLYAAGQPVLSALDTTQPKGNSMAVRSQGFRVRAERLRAQSVNRDDYTFNGAPTDFYSPQGHWSVFSRWPCYGDWSFFGGTGLNPVLWSKRTYSGDVVAEMYAHPQMILPKEPGYTHPGDLNMTLCGDGKNPSSGYSFVIAGWDNTRSKLLKGSTVLAENTGDEAFFHQTINHNTKWHRTWFYIRAEARRAVKDGKTGVQLTLTLDDTPILTAFDPNPLSSWDKGGRVAFWTVDSTMMIARAKIEAQKLGLRTLPGGVVDATPVKIAAASKLPQAVMVGEIQSALVTPEKVGWNVKDPVSGGAFEVKLNDAPLTATPATHLDFDAQIPQGVKVDAYVIIDGTRYSVEMTGGQRPDATAPSLGKMTRNGNKWSFDLGSALAKELPGQKSWRIDSLTLGARHGDAYRWLGFDGNALGSSYQLSSWDLK